MLILSLFGIIVFVTTVILLSYFSILDIRDRQVPNTSIGFAMLLVTILGILSGHMFTHFFLRLTAIVSVAVLTLLLFRLGSIGGADAKIALIVAVGSPGFEFMVSVNFLFEGVLAAWFQLAVMLIIGFLYQMRVKDNPERKPAPLIPFLLVGYLLVQLFAFI